MFSFRFGRNPRFQNYNQNVNQIPTITINNDKKSFMKKEHPKKKVIPKTKINQEIPNTRYSDVILEIDREIENLKRIKQKIIDLSLQMSKPENKKDNGINLIYDDNLTEQPIKDITKEEIKTEEIKTEKIKPQEIKQQEIKTEEQKDTEKNTESKQEVKQEIKEEKIKQEEKKQEIKQQEEKKQEEIKENPIVENKNNEDKKEIVEVLDVKEIINEIDISETK